MIFGILYIIMGLMVLPIPVIGWIVGLILILGGIIKIISGIVSAATPKTTTNTVTERIIIKEEMPKLEEDPELSIADEIEKLSALFEKGHITQDEFDSSKKRIFQTS